jgi:L-ascorbate metabolism protein UlaG (beta-lactamase superfamily)
MRLRLLRNATLKLDILGRTILIDPFFAPKGTRPSFAGRAPISSSICLRVLRRS